jgi:predicted phosphodiesterase
MTTRTALLSDTHGNTPGLAAVLADIQRVGCPQVFMLGDIINGVDPRGCVQLLRRWAAENSVTLACLKGNGEEYLLTPDRDQMPQTDADWNQDMLLLTQWWEDHLTADDLAFIRTFQDYILWDDACLAHDNPLDRMLPERWHTPGLDHKYQEWFFHSPGVAEDMPAERWQALWDFMDERGFQRVFVGHSHVPFIREEGGRLVCNIGSAGAPLDGDPRPSWALVEAEPDGGRTVTLRRVDYDLDLTQRLIDATPDYHGFASADYKAAYKKWFATGLHWRMHLPR